MAGKRKKSAQDLLMALACGATVAQAAAKVGLSERTVYRRLADSAFRQEVDRIRTEMVQRSSAMLTAASLEAVKTLVTLLNSDTERVRHSAACSILNYGVQLRELTELQMRLSVLEGRLKDPPVLPRAA